jgi:hypothetical protein
MKWSVADTIVIAVVIVAMIVAAGATWVRLHYESAFDRQLRGRVMHGCCHHHCCACYIMRWCNRCGKSYPSSPAHPTPYWHTCVPMYSGHHTNISQAINQLGV